MSKNLMFSVSFIFMCFILFEIGLYISVKEKFANIEYEIKSMNVELEELRKTQRLISQDAEYALRVSVESAGGNE